MPLGHGLPQSLFKLSQQSADDRKWMMTFFVTSLSITPQKKSPPTPTRGIFKKNYLGKSCLSIVLCKSGIKAQTVGKAVINMAVADADRATRVAKYMRA